MALREVTIAETIKYIMLILFWLHSKLCNYRGVVLVVYFRCILPGGKGRFVIITPIYCRVPGVSDVTTSSLTCQVTALR